VGWDLARTARAWAELMRRLGYGRYVAQGGDVGAGVTDTMGRQGPEGLVGIHTNLLVPALGDPTSLPADGESERAALAALRTFSTSGNGYFVEMATRPQTIGYALLDSPVALAAWMIDHDTDAYRTISRAFVDGQPSGNLTRDHVLDNVTAYWLSGRRAARRVPPAAHPGRPRATPLTAVRPARLGWRSAPAGVHLLVSLAAGGIAGGIAAPLVGWATAGLIAWVAAGLVFLVWTWAALWPLGAEDTARAAVREDGSRAVRDLALVGISIGTLMAVALAIFRAHQHPPVRVALGVGCIATSWLVLNTVYTLRYARLYYSEPRGGVDFDQQDDPAFQDFAYLAFTIGMCFQVSDTSLQETAVRATALRQAVTSFVFDVVIIAVTVNVVAGLGT
jgi:uncharacterized membrane protein